MMFVEILTRIHGDRPISALVMQSLGDASREIREAAVSGVVEHGAGKALPMYVRALKNRDNAVVNRAGEALSQIGNESLILPLVDALITRHVYVVMIAEAPVSVAANGSGAQQQILPPSVQSLLATGQLPYGVQVQMPQQAARVREVSVEKEEQNDGVLTALQKITGEDFGFDKLSWKKWYSAQRNQATSAGSGKSRP
jgi:HEAT repeats